MSRVDERAAVIYRFLTEHLNEPFVLGDLLAGAGLRNNATTTAAIKRARDLAEADGLCLPVACPANGFTYTVTDDPGAVFDPAYHLGRIVAGVQGRKRVHDEFMRSRRQQLTEAERLAIDARAEADAAINAAINAVDAMSKATIAMRREGRKTEAPT